MRPAIPRGFRLAALLPGLVSGILPSLALAAPAAAPVRLVPHRAVYELSLASTRGDKGIESARGRIAFELTGNACEGYGLRYRQVTLVNSSESGSKLSDLKTTNFESGDGTSFRFRNDVKMQGAAPQIVDGVAERRSGARTAVTLKAPKRQTVTLGPDVLFPNAQLRDIITAARAGQSMLSTRVYDGSDDGRKPYETLAIIGHRIAAGEGPPLEAAARLDGLKGLDRWPIVLSYFDRGREDQTPSYVLSFDLYENGISRALRLDYGDFILKGDMARLDMLPDRGCPR